MSRLTRQSTTKRKRSSDHNGSFKSQVQTKSKIARTAQDTDTESLLSSDDKTSLCNKHEEGPPLPIVVSEDPIGASQVKKMALDHNNDSDIDTETAEDTNGNSNNHDSASDADNDSNGGLDAEDGLGAEDGNTNDNGETVEEPVNNPGEDDSNGNDDGNDSNGDNAENEPAANVPHLARLEEMLDTLNNRFNTTTTNVQNMENLLTNTERNIDRANRLLLNLQDQVDQANVRVNEASDQVALLTPRADLREIMTVVTDFQDHTTRRMDTLERNLKRAEDLLKILRPGAYAEMINADNILPVRNGPPVANDIDRPADNTNQPQAVVDSQQEQIPLANGAQQGQEPLANDAQQGQEPPVNDAQQGQEPPVNDNRQGQEPPVNDNRQGQEPPGNENQQDQAPPLHRPQGNGGEGANNNALDNSFEIQQLTFTQNIEYK